MDSFQDELLSLESRIPELNRQLAKLSYFPSSKIPKGLFAQAETLNDCMASLIHDLERIQSESQANLKLYLAKQIQQKIRVLVHVCKKKPSAASTSKPDLLKAMNTREQYLSARESKRAELNSQKCALEARLMSKNSALNLSEPVRSKLEAELKVIELELTELT